MVDAGITGGWRWSTIATAFRGGTQGQPARGDTGGNAVGQERIMSNHGASLFWPAVALAVALSAGTGVAAAGTPATPQATDDAAVAAYRARLEREIAEVKVEYDRRLARDGKASADAWLAEAAREMGRREGEAARRAQGR